MKTELNAFSNSVVVGALSLVCVGLATATVISARKASALSARLEQADAPSDQAAALQRSGSDDSAFRKLLDEKDAELIRLRNENEQLKRTAQARVVPNDQATAARAARSTNPGSGTNRISWLDRIRTEDPERYKQIQQQREQRRQERDQQMQEQFAQLDARLQTATPEEADLLNQIADALQHVNDLRDKWAAIRDLPDDERAAQAQQLAAESRAAYATLRDLQQQDRTLQLGKLATQLGVADPNALIEPVTKIIQDTSPPRGPGGGGFGRGGGGDAGGAANTSSSGASSTPTPSSPTPPR